MEKGGRRRKERKKDLQFPKIVDASGKHCRARL